MSRLVCSMVGLTLLAAVGSAALVEPKEMKVRVFAGPERLPELAARVLEFYDVTSRYFVAAVTEQGYEEFRSRGFKVEVLVEDVRALAMEQCPAHDFGFFHTYEQIRDTWAIISQNHSNICRLDTIGRSANNYLLLAMKVSDNPGQMEPESRVCFDYSIHGNENIATEIAHYALIQIVQGYGVDPDITRWVNEREIWLLPMVNPDGVVSRSRYNGNGVDLNRNYGYAWDGGGPSVFSESETQALFHFGRKYPMGSWSQYHSGTKRAMWPWGYTEKATMDSVVHEYEMQQYSAVTGYPACQIARGLYPVSGGSTDWYYGTTGALGFGIEVTNGQPGPPDSIEAICLRDWNAMKGLIERVMWGVSGVVTDSVSGGPLAARVVVEPPSWMTYTDSVGYFHKNLHAGTYALTAYANGYAPKTVTGVVVPADTFVQVDFALAPDSTEPVGAFWNMTCQIEESSPNTNPTNAVWALGKRDGQRFSLGQGGWASYDMGERTPIINGPSTDFYVVEDDADPEACSVYVSNEWNGPWHYVGFGTGTQGYDLAAAGQTAARYVRIADDGVGGSGPYAGFDLDAIEAVVVNAPAIVYQGQTVIDSPPGGNNDGKLDPGEEADLIVLLRNLGRVGVSGVTGVLRTADTLLAVLDSSGTFGNLEPESLRSNEADRFVVAASHGTPREHVAEMNLLLMGTDYEDSVRFSIVVGELRTIDPIPDGPRQPPLYWAFDDVDTGYAEHPIYDWVELRGVGTRLTFDDDETKQVNLPAGFGSWRYYGDTYSQVSICSNGWIAPGYTTNEDWTNTGLPSGQQPPNLALFWDDLYGPSGNDIWYLHDAGNHRLVIEYDSIHYYSPRGTWDKAEVIIYDTTLATPSGDNLIVMQYYSANKFTSSTVGIEDPSCAIGIQCLLDSDYHRGCAPIAPGRAIKFTTAGPTGLAEEHWTAGVRPAVAVRANPFSDLTSVRYSVPRAGRVVLAVYDNAGRWMRTLVCGEQQPGRYDVTWDGTDRFGRRAAAGVYWLRLETEEAATAIKAVKTR